LNIAINKNVPLDVIKPKFVKMIEEGDEKLFELCEYCYLITEETKKLYLEFRDQGRKVISCIEDCINWVDRFFYAKTGTGKFLINK
jgi:hypothetical protein